VLDYPAWTVWLHVAAVTLTWNTLLWAWLAAGRTATAPTAEPLPSGGGVPGREPAAVGR
jgi:cytochrome c oxidase assembly protein subunit 15